MSQDIHANFDFAYAVKSLIKIQQRPHDRRESKSGITGFAEFKMLFKTTP